MKKVLFNLIIVLFALSCSTDESNNIQNSFSFNGSGYTTSFAYHNPGGRAFVFSSIDRTLDSYTEVRGRFDLRHPDGNLEPMTYTTNNNGIQGVVEFNKNIIKENGEFISSGETLAFTCCSESNSNGFQSGTATVNSIEYNNDGRVTFIDITYNFKWDGKEINGNFSGEVYDNPY